MVLPQLVEYMGYALQLILVFVLVISLACKSWALLGVCLGAAVVLLVLVLVQLVSNTQFARTNPFKNVSLMKTGMAGVSSSNLHNSYIHPMTTAPTTQPFYPMAPLPPATPNHQLHAAYTHAPLMDERMAMDLMSHADRGPSIQAPVQKFRHAYFVPQSQGQDLGPDPYRVAVSSKPTQLEPHMDPYHVKNPMNSLSYLYKP